MQPEDFFTGEAGAWGTPDTLALNQDLMNRLRSAPCDEHDDLEVAVALTQLIIEDFTAYGTGGSARMSDEESLLALKAHRMVVERLGLDMPRLPFRHLSSFYDYWRRNGMSGGGGYAARRECIEGLFGPIREALDVLEEQQFRQRTAGVPKGAFKNLIFAADGPKPELVFRDAINNDVEIVKNAEHCLVYARPLTPRGLSWQDLVTWWMQDVCPEVVHDELEAGRVLWRRLYCSLKDSPLSSGFSRCTPRCSTPPAGSIYQR